MGGWSTSGGNYNPPNPARAKMGKPFVHSAGVGHTTAAHRTILNNAIGGGARSTRPKRSSRSTHRIKAHTTKRGVQVRGHRAKQRTVKSTGAKAQHFKKGSLAAKRHMSKLRAMRTKKAA